MRIFKISVASLKDLVKNILESEFDSNVVFSIMLMFLFVTYS